MERCFRHQIRLIIEPYGEIFAGASTLLIRTAFEEFCDDQGQLLICAILVYFILDRETIDMKISEVMITSVAKQAQNPRYVNCADRRFMELERLKALVGILLSVLSLTGDVVCL